MEVTEDGFKLSEMDLAQRQEGDVLGARQHGRNALRLVNVMRDGAVIEAAYTDAYNIVFNNVLSASESALLNQELQMIAHE
jgi:ATP-dependent DNA helicase RecG